MHAYISFLWHHEALLFSSTYLPKQFLSVDPLDAKCFPVSPRPHRDTRGFLCLSTLSDWKIVTDSRKFDHMTPLLYQLKWLPAKQSLCYRDAVLTDKCFSGLAPKYLVDKFTKRSNIHAHHTRQQTYYIYQWLYKTATGQRTFAYRGASIWNNTPYSKMAAILVFFCWVLFTCKLALVASFKGKYSFEFLV